MEIACYRDDNTPYVSAKDIEDVKLLKWFADNLMKSNGDKCYLLVNTSDKVNSKIENFHIYNSKCEKLLGVKFDHKLTFDDHISELCKKASQKVQALPRVTPYLNISKGSVFLKAVLHRKFVSVLLYRCVAVVLTIAK